MDTPTDAPPASLFVGNNLALDFINTCYGTGEEAQEVFTDDARVLEWLKAAEVVSPSVEIAPEGLMTRAQALRSCAWTALEAAQEGKPAEVSLINEMLAQGQPARSLVWNDEAVAFELEQHRPHHDASGLLAPIAEALVALLTSEQFVYVKQCEAHDCVLLFLDQTKSHRRRWCNMATCGNRMKVAAFRARKKGT
ncbi:CGNR zinc finger domain-containing protein [Kushneria indalinina]|uniref:Putative RNA-binding Zn ribbon-like protein n=1 Tax=Kushneria indalinina DSM 14324 TaxID=1122140 RepID=A0A3D9E1U2_9GAMM|nr:ABATE domain-containing protein [Kushneria indalinina]REC96424.1 putative RNA-binding Zn ribbon-like protein [Kushneria indalinina DSM 14324]